MSRPLPPGDDLPSPAGAPSPLDMALARFEAAPSDANVIAMAEACTSLPIDDALRRLAAVPSTPRYARVHALSAELALRNKRPALALQALLLAVATDRTWQTWTLLGTAHLGVGQTESAKAAFVRAIHFNPAAPQPHQHLVGVCLATGGVASALHAYRALTRDIPNNTHILVRLAGVLTQSGDNTGAISTLQRAVTLDGDNTTVLHTLGALLHKEGHIEASSVILHRAHRLNRDHVGVAQALAGARLSLGDPTGAAEILDHILANHAATAVLLTMRGLAAQLASQPDVAQGFMDRAAAASPDDEDVAGMRAQTSGINARALDTARLSRSASPAAACALGENAQTTDERRYALSHLTEMIPTQPEDTYNLPALLLVAARLHDKLGEYDEAWALAARANALRRPPYDATAALVTTRRIISAFPHDFVDNVGHASDQPVFVVGMPRSGTTLLERMTDRHPDIVGVGELADLMQLAHETTERAHLPVPWPEVTPYLSASTRQLLGERYVTSVRAASAPANPVRVVDKMPHNFSRVGFIRQILPNAKIVHMTRDPRDVAISIFFQNFMYGHRYSFDLADIAHEIKLHDLFLRHWRSIGVPMYRVSYEDLVADPEPLLRGLCDWLDVPWNRDLLTFHESKRISPTSSNQQVRQPLYQSSRARWRNYESHLSPLLNALKEPFDD